MLLVESEGLGLEGCLLFSGGADRTIRVWDPTLRDAKKACVQTLRAHGGTVAALAYCEGLLVSASTDKTIKRVDEGRELMLYPWLSLRQTLADLDGWANALALHLGESSALYVGDEHGTISVRARAQSHGAIPTRNSSDASPIPLQVYRVAALPRARQGRQRERQPWWRRQPKAHALGHPGD